jgi:hypothetical protein
VGLEAMWDSKIAMWDSKNRLENLMANAKALYQVGRSFREIEAELNIPRSSLHRWALAEGWQKGRYLPLVHRMAQTAYALSLLTPIQRQVVEHEVELRLRESKLAQENPSDYKNPWLAKLRLSS